MNLTSLGLIAALAIGASATQSVAPASAAQRPAKQLNVSANFTPNPPSSKSTDKIVVSVKDASGKPVSGATVRIATSMPTMSMKGAEMTAHESGHGTYTAATKLNYATTWAFDITATSKGQSGTAHVEKVLK